MITFLLLFGETMKLATANLAGRALVLTLSVSLIFAATIGIHPDAAQADETRRITLEAAFGKPYINGQLPGRMCISPDDGWIACVWAEDARGYSELWLLETDGGMRRKLTDTKEARHQELIKANEEIKDADKRKTDEEIIEALERERNISRIAWDPDGAHLWIIYRGDLYRINVFDKDGDFPAMEKILHMEGHVGDIRFSEDGRFLGISVLGEIWIRNQENGSLWQLTADANGGKTNYGLEWSASGHYLGFYQQDTSGLRTSWMADYLQENVNVIPITRPRPGDRIGRSRIGIINLEAENEPEIIFIETDGEEEVYGESMVWAPDTDRLLVSKISKDTETWTVWEVIDFDAGKAVKIFSYTDEAWFNGVYSQLFWGPDEDSFVTCLEKTGWSHVYTVNFGERLASEKAKFEKENAEIENESELAADSELSVDTEHSVSDEVDDNDSAEDEDPAEVPFPEPVQITFGDYEVTWLEVLDDRRTAYIITSEDGPSYRAVKKLDIPTRGKKRITLKPGMWSFGSACGEGMRISDSGRIAVIYGSDFGSPPALYSLWLEKAKTRLLLDARPVSWRRWRWVFPEKISFMNTEHPGRVHALLYLPPYHKDGDTRPVIVHIHGAGYAQDVLARHSWFDALHTYMADTLGYAVLAIDYRGSSGYGRNWRTQVIGRLGHIEDSDARAGVEYLRRSGIVDPDRIGIWGWSYGGFQTNMSMFLSPDFWKVGVAMSAPNDWHNYNHWYVTQRLDEPEDNEDAYKESSPITYADALKGELLMVHGILDNNVLAQDFMLLSAELINKDKQFDMFVFPEDGHGLNSTNRMIFFAKLVTKYFEDHFGKGEGALATD